MVLQIPLGWGGQASAQTQWSPILFLWVKMGPRYQLGLTKIIHEGQFIIWPPAGILKDGSGFSTVNSAVRDSRPMEGR